jgi:hypothetical protein
MQFLRKLDGILAEVEKDQPTPARYLNVRAFSAAARVAHLDTCSLVFNNLRRRPRYKAPAHVHQRTRTR